MAGYWIKGNTIYAIGTHIHFVILNPQLFCLTIREIKQIHKKHKEKLFTEGNAREEIIKKVSSFGWIRVRKYRDYWSIQSDVYRKRKRPIKNFIAWAIFAGKTMKKTDRLVLVGFEDGTRLEKMAQQYLKENKAVPSYSRLTVK